MLRSRSFLDLRTLALVSAAACVLCAPMVAAAASSTAATSATKSTTAKKSHGKTAASEQRADLNERVQAMSERLSLTDDQVTKVREILQSNASQMSALHAKYKGMLETPENKSTMAKAKEEVHASTQAKLAHVLSAGQMAEYRKMGTEHTKHASESATKAASATATQK